MQLTPSDLSLLGQAAIEAAQDAGTLIASYALDSVEVLHKTGGESHASQVVTEVDYLCQERILSRLQPLCKPFDLGLLTEESVDDCSRFEKDFFWSIDPLDGTLPFIESSPGYAVSIALVARCGTPKLGVVYDPRDQMLYHAISGQGAFRNGVRWEPKPADSFTVIGDRSFVKQPFYTEIMDQLEGLASELGYEGLKTRMYGGAAMNACWVLEQAPACYFKFPKKQAGGGSLWDYAATAAIFQELGAVATDLFGALLDLNRTDSTFMNHRGVLFASSPEWATRIRTLSHRLLN